MPRRKSAQRKPKGNPFKIQVHSGTQKAIQKVSPKAAEKRWPLLHQLPREEEKTEESRARVQITREAFKSHLNLIRAKERIFKQSVVRKREKADSQKISNVKHISVEDQATSGNGDKGTNNPGVDVSYQLPDGQTRQGYLKVEHIKHDNIKKTRGTFWGSPLNVPDYGRRAIALYDMANYLNQGELIPDTYLYSWEKENKKEVPAYVMEWVNGADESDVNGNNGLYRKKRINLAIMDFIAGNPDRHGKNVKVVVGDDIQILGIDNDMAFPSEKLPLFNKRTAEEHLSELGLIGLNRINDDIDINVAANSLHLAENDETLRPPFLYQMIWSGPNPLSTELLILTRKERDEIAANYNRMIEDETDGGFLGSQSMLTEAEKEGVRRRIMILADRIKMVNALEEAHEKEHGEVVRHQGGEIIIRNRALGADQTGSVYTIGTGTEIMSGPSETPPEAESIASNFSVNAQVDEGA